ncbi:LacI family DNA-binding transcriptional regulator [Paratractidigestivibacter sp.]|uniref:LacI family DNA-binding transcriptional regulator n=1 Tax=Paratractidigestivibacter sp. TaxID=2847316 RepID=UPI002ABE6C34|nr:LacI family DNA-binding transcriptional regulator [Paratractidigestivibacter sp.]
MSGRVTAQDVAKAAGVSPATVSLVFHNKPGIKAQTRSHVLATAMDLGYKPSAPAQLPAEIRTLTLAIFRQEGSANFESPFFEHLVKGISDEIRRTHGYRLSVSYFYGDSDAEPQLEELRATAPAGIIVLATEMHSRDVDTFTGLGLPLVLLDNCYGSKAVDSVVIDNERGAKAAVRYLSTQGHKSIGMLHSSEDLKNFRERREGFLSAIRKLRAKGQVDEPVIVDIGHSIGDSYRRMCEYLDAIPEVPTAFFASNDHVASYCIRALQEHGLRVPEDVSVIGFDDVEFAASMNPPLTTMRVPQESMGELAVKRLHDLIDGRTRSIVHLRVQPELVARSSVRRLVH